MNFKQFLNILLARYKIAIFVLIATVTLVLLVNLLLPNKYVASTSVLLDVRSPDPLIGLSMGGMAMPSYMATQNEIITSDRVAQSVVKLLKLDENPQIREQWRTATDGKGQMVVWLGKLLAQKLEVKPSRESDVINISFAAEDPAFAALIANAFAQAYINTNLELKVEPAKQYAQWFQLRAKELRAELEQTQARLSAFQKKSGMVSVGSRMQSVENSKIAELSGQLVLNETQLAEIQSKRQSAGDTLVDVMQNSTIQNLKAEIIRLEVKLQELSRNLGKNHPQYQAMEKDMILELKDIQFFQAKQANASPEKIKLSGLVFHSSLAIREITTSVQVDSLQVIVHLTPATARLSGNLDYTITVPTSVNTVTFGNLKTVIWNRSTGITHRK